MPNPEATIRQVLTLGRDAITANAALIDKALDGTPADVLAQVKAYWARNPPNIVLGYARLEGPFPCWAVVLQGDNPHQDYLGLGEEVLADDFGFLGEGEAIGKVRTASVFGIIVYAENPDITAAYYRICRYILNTGRRRLIQEGLQEPQLSGAELAPDPRYIPDNLFVRRLTLTVEIEECWSEDDELASALGVADERAYPVTVAGIAHEDVGGGVHPYEEEG